MNSAANDLLVLLQRPISFHRCLLDVAGDHAGAVWLGQAIYWSGTGKNGKRRCDTEGWFFKTIEEWEEETGCSRKQQERVRAVLRGKGILEEKKEGLPCQLFYRVNFDALQASLYPVVQTGLHPVVQTGKKHGAQTDGDNVLYDARDPETTAETTAETTPPTAPVGPDLMDLTDDERPPVPKKRHPSFTTWARDVWNPFAAQHGLPKVRLDTPQDKRERDWSARCRTPGWFELLPQVLEKIPKSPFLMGKVDPKPGYKRMFANVDWLLTQAAVTKTLEGGYDDGGNPQPTDPNAELDKKYPYTRAPGETEEQLQQRLQARWKLD